MTRAAPLPGVLILTTTPPLYLPILLLASHIKHPLKETYPILIAEHWASHLTRHGIEASPASSEPIVWLDGVPSFAHSSVNGSSRDSQENYSDIEDGGRSDIDDGDDQITAIEDDQEDEDGNVWRGLKKDMAAKSIANKSSLAGSKGTAIANLTIGQVTYLAPVPPGTDPSLPLSFLSHLHYVLSMYFPASSSSPTSAASSNALTPIPASVLSMNFDLIYQLLQEMLDDGRPLTTEYNSLKGIVRGRAWWEDIMARMGSLSSSQTAPPPEISPLAWRPTQVRYSRNEVYVDIVESLSGVMDRKGEPIGGLDLTMSLACKTKLSGTPDMALTLYPSPVAHPSAYIGPSFHPCVRTKRWAREGVLSFVPPDGVFELARFDVPFTGTSRSSKGLTLPLSSSSSSSSAEAVGWGKDIPFTLKAKRSSAKDSKGREWTFEITLAAKSGRSTPTCSEDLEVCFHVAPKSGMEHSAEGNAGAANVEARTSVSNRSFLSSATGSTSSTYTSVAAADDAGVWRYDAREGLVRWSIPRLGSSSSSSSGSTGPSEVTLKGTVSSTSSLLGKPSSLLVAFSLPLGLPSLSGVRVASLSITGVDYKPFKGVRGATRGRIEWRW